MNYQQISYIIILLLGIASYGEGIKQMLRGLYSPSIFSRVVWLLLAINSFAGVIASKSTNASVLLAAIFLVGNLIICLVSFSKGSKEFGKLELFCFALLLVSCFVWIFFNNPLINLGISLLAHFIGALPTYKRVWFNPRSESSLFWFYFFGASALSIFASNEGTLKTLIFPLYFTLFDGSLFLLTLRK